MESSDISSDAQTIEWRPRSASPVNMYNWLRGTLGNNPTPEAQAPGIPYGANFWMNQRPFSPGDVAEYPPSDVYMPVRNAIFDRVLQSLIHFAGQFQYQDAVTSVDRAIRDAGGFEEWLPQWRGVRNPNIPRFAHYHPENNDPSMEEDWFESQMEAIRFYVYLEDGLRNTEICTHTTGMKLGIPEFCAPEAMYLTWMRIQLIKHQIRQVRKMITELYDIIGDESEWVLVEDETQSRRIEELQAQVRKMTWEIGAETRERFRLVERANTKSILYGERERLYAA